MRYKISQYARLHKVTIRTVWNWLYSGRLKTERTPKGGWLIIEDTEQPKERVCIYARISSSENKNILEIQKERLLNYCSAKGYIVDKIVTEIDSGLNDNRSKLETILLDKSFSKIIVEHKNRLSSFGFNYIEKLLNLDQRTIEYINSDKSNSIELINDLSHILSDYYFKLNDKKISKVKLEKLIKELKNEC